MEKELQKLVDNGAIKWLPWVGENYENNRILLLGESHRYNDEDGSFEKHQKPSFTRQCVAEMGVDMNEYKVSLYKNTHRFFNLKNNEQTSKFWNKVAFMNIVQKPMKQVGSRPEPPNNKNYYDGWDSVLKTVEVLKPKVIICFSLTGADRIQKGIINSSFKCDKYEWDYKIKGTWTKRALISDSNNSIKIVFLKHPAGRGGNNFDEWREFLKNEISSAHFEKLFSNRTNNI